MRELQRRRRHAGGGGVDGGGGDGGVDGRVAVAVAAAAAVAHRSRLGPVRMLERGPRWDQRVVVVCRRFQARGRRGRVDGAAPLCVAALRVSLRGPLTFSSAQLAPLKPR
eukprot:7051589-Prymnesium_polylepis.1